MCISIPYFSMNVHSLKIFWYRSTDENTISTKIYRTTRAKKNMNRKKKNMSMKRTVWVHVMCTQFFIPPTCLPTDITCSLITLLSYNNVCSIRIIIYKQNKSYKKKLKTKHKRTQKFTLHISRSLLNIVNFVGTVINFAYIFAFSSKWVA
jgi:hypothetical protein